MLIRIANFSTRRLARVSLQAVLAFQSLSGFVRHAQAGEFHWLNVRDRAIEGLSADGRTVFLGFAYWTRGTGLVNLAPDDGREYVVRGPIYADGTVLGAVRDDPDSPYAAFRWTAANGFEYLSEQLPPPPGDRPSGSIARRMSADGTIIGGSSNGRHALWTPSGLVEIGPFPPGTVYTAAQGLPPLSFGGMSDDGSIVVGSFTVESPTASQARYAYRWSIGEGIQDLGALPGQSLSHKTRISGDGSVIVGVSGNEAFRWTEVAGMQGLGVLPGWSQSAADGVSVNGEVILGRSFHRNAGSQPGEMFVWDEVHGMRNLTQMILAEFGLDLIGAGATPNYISTDLRTVAGTYVKPTFPHDFDNWVVTFDQPLVGGRVPEPSSQAILAALFGGMVFWHRWWPRA